ncbi:MAG: hypothetical protein KAI66_05040 [Lentisphaeria bacterium]|nr:hypothetical protein [Lentisphaeria bacterium]
MADQRDDHIILAIHVTDRVEQASSVQAVLTNCGGNIKTRIGLHEATNGAASPNGVILLELVGSDAQVQALIASLNDIVGVETKNIVFGH